jgi:hypothetical protein
MKITVLKTAERKPPPIACPWMIDYPTETTE